MKNLFPLFLVLLFFSVNGQSPQSINYQAVVRDASGIPVANNTQVVLRFIIHDGSSSGTPVYTEVSNTLLANQFGLVSTVIGANANLSTISWSSGAKWLEVDANVSGAGFIAMGTSKLVSVPYALYADSASYAPEHQTLSLSGNQLSITSGNSVTLPNIGGSSGGSYYQQNLNLGGLSGSGFGAGSNTFTTATQDANSSWITIVSNFAIYHINKDSITGQYIPFYPYQGGNGVLPVPGGAYYNGSIYTTYYYNNVWNITISGGLTPTVTLIGTSISTTGNHLLFSDGSLLYLHNGGSAWTKLSGSGTTLTNQGTLTLPNTSNATQAVMWDGTNFFSLEPNNTVTKYDATGTILSTKTYGNVYPAFTAMSNIDATKLYLIQPTYAASNSTTPNGQATFFPFTKP